MEGSWLALENKVVIVTGGAKGIGYATAMEFLRVGAYVSVLDVDRTPPVFDGYGDRVLYICTDVTDKGSVDSAVEKVVAAFGTVDVLVNNAGINLPRLLVDENDAFELDEEAWDKVMGVNVKGLFFCSQAAARVMIKQGRGVIINMSSECGYEGSEGQSVYAASKGAVNALTRSWAKELGKRGVRVVGVAPGVLEETALRTEAYERALAYTRGISVEALRRGYESSGTTPLGRAGRLSEVANTVVFIASERSGYIHGTTVNVAGGKTRG